MKHLLDNLHIWKMLSFENIQYSIPWSGTIKARGLNDYFTSIVEENNLQRPMITIDHIKN